MHVFNEPILRLSKVFRDRMLPYHIYLRLLKFRIKFIRRWSFGCGVIRRFKKDMSVDYYCYDIGFIYFPWGKDKLRPWKGLSIQYQYIVYPVKEYNHG